MFPRLPKTPLFLLLLSGGWYAFFLQGIRLYDNDYDLWLPLARNTSWPEALWQVAAPFLGSWGFQDRPVEVLAFKGLWAVFGWNAKGFAAFKATLGIALVLMTWAVGRVCGLPSPLAALAGILVMSSPSVLGSLLWIGDFGILVPLFGGAAFLCLPGYSWKGVRRVWTGWAGGIVFFVLLAAKSKASGLLLAPVVLGASVWLQPKRWKRHAVLATLLWAALFPWNQIALLPILLEGGHAPAAYEWRAPNMASWLELALPPMSQEFAHILTYPPSGFLAHWFPFGVLIVLVSGMLLFREVRQKHSGTIKPLALAIPLWASLECLSFASYPRLPPLFMGRYLVTIIPLAAGLIIAYGATALDTRTQPFKRRWEYLFAILLAFQCFQGGWQSVLVRRSLGRNIIGWSQSVDAISGFLEGASVYTVGFPVTSGGEGFARNTFQSVEQKELSGVLDHFSIPTLLILKDGEINHPQATLWRHFSGADGALFDKFFPPDEQEGYRLYLVKNP